MPDGERPSRDAGRPDIAAALSRFATAPARLADACRTTDHRPRPVASSDGAWTAAEIVRHLIAVECDVWWVRLRSLREVGEPRWAWTEPGLEPDLAGASLGEVLHRFAEVRRASLEILGGYDDAAFARTGLHETFGRLDAVALLGIAGDHDDEHIATLAGAPGR